jgi:FtsZ-binding cell division protein ZapB
LNADLQKAQDMLNAMQAQRDQALNGIVMLQAELADLRRKLNATEPGSPTQSSGQSLPAENDANPSSSIAPVSNG